jgi:hypothetical protein
MGALFFFWVLFAIGVGVYASSRGRNIFAWTVLAMFVSPLICVVALAVAPEVTSTTTDTAAPLTITAATATELLRRVEELFERGALTDGDLGRIRALASREMPAPKIVERKPVASEFTRPCPSCGGLVHPQATTCMHCWARLPRVA